MSRTATPHKWAIVKSISQATHVQALIVGGIIGVVVALAYWKITIVPAQTMAIFVVLVLQFVVLFILEPSQRVSSARVGLFALGNSMAITLILLRYSDTWSRVDPLMILLVAITFPVMVLVLAAVLHAVRGTSRRR